MSSNKIISTKNTDNRRLLITLIVVLVSITSIYQLRPFLTDYEFSYISITSYAILPALVTFYASLLAIKLWKQNHLQAKAFVLFAIGAGCWFIAEQLWQLYDHVWDGSPFPSEADIFYIAAYPLMSAFLFISLKPVIKSISRNVWLFAIGIAVSFLIPSVLAAYDDMSGEDAFPTIIALAYPILGLSQIIPAIVGILYLTKKEVSISWMLILFGFITYAIADTFFLFTEIDGSYYDGHPVDMFWVYTFILVIFAFHIRLKITNNPSQGSTEFFSENVKFETITNFGIPLTLSIFCLIIFISLIHAFFIQEDTTVSTQNLTLGIIAILGVFIAIVITINKNLSRLVKMRTSELIQQRDNLENLVEEKTQDVLKAERLSAIGELSGRLAHDLRNPLSVIKMSVELMKNNSSEKKVSDPEISKRLDTIEKSVDRISHQVDDVLGFVRSSPLEFVNSSIREIILNSIEKVTIPSYVQVNISKNDVKINCDPIKLDIVFINLIVNSIQAMPNGGELSIEISSKGDFVFLKFSDTGKGIPNDVIKKVFDPLFTTKQMGTGLGLASCKNIIEQHKGEISVTNDPTTFLISIPKNLSN